MPLDVICPGCRGIFFETNDKDGTNPEVPSIRSIMVQKYDPDLPANSAMFRMKPGAMGVYDDILHFEDLKGEAIGPCPGCGGPLSGDNFKLETRPQALDPLICEICLRGPFKTEQGKNNHMRMIHKG